LDHPDLHVEKMVQIGSGIWYTCAGNSQLRLIHKESYRAIQEKDMGSALQRIVKGEAHLFNSLSILEFKHGPCRVYAVSLMSSHNSYNS